MFDTMYILLCMMASSSVTYMAKCWNGRNAEVMDPHF